MTLFHFLWAHATSEGGLGMVVIIWLLTMFLGLTMLLQPGSDPLHCSTIIDHNSSWENALLKSVRVIMWASVVMLNGNLIGLARWRDPVDFLRSVIKVKFWSNFEGRPETREPLPSNANCWDSILAILPGWTRACVLFCNTWHIACHYSLSWWLSLVCLSLVDMKKMQVLMWCRIWFFQQPSRVLLCLFLNEVSWRATRKVVQCWTKRQTYCCSEHLFRLKAPWPRVLQESKCLPYCGAKHLAGRLGEHSMMQYDSYLKKPWTPWDNAFPECLQDCLYMFVKMILIGLPSGWTCGVCRSC